MIKESGVVTSVGKGYVLVETERKSSCGSCAANKGCGTAVLGKVFGAKRASVRAINQLELSVGDVVSIGLEEGALIKGSLVLYFVPLVFMFLLAALGEAISQAASLGSEAMTVMFALIGLLLGLVAVRFFAKGIKNNQQYQARVLGKINSGESLIRFVS